MAETTCFIFEWQTCFIFERRRRMASMKLFILTTTADCGNDVFIFERRRRMASTKLFILTTTADGGNNVFIFERRRRMASMKLFWCDDDCWWRWRSRWCIIFNNEGGWLQRSCFDATTTADGVDEVDDELFLTTKANGYDKVVLMWRRLLMALAKSIRFDNKGEWRWQSRLEFTTKLFWCDDACWWRWQSRWWIISYDEVFFFFW